MGRDQRHRDRDLSFQILSGSGSRLLSTLTVSETRGHDENDECDEETSRRHESNHPEDVVHLHPDVFLLVRQAVTDRSN